MLILFFIVITVFLLFDVQRYRNICSPVVVFCCLWAVIVALASLGLFEFSGYSDNALCSVALGVVGFGLGSLITTRVLDGRATAERGGVVGVGLEKSNSEHSSRIGERLIYGVLALVFVGEVLSLANTVMALIGGASYVQIRGALLGYSDGQTIETNRLLLAYLTYFCGPALTALVPVAVTSLFERKRQVFCVGVLACLAMSIAASGGRITIIYIVGQLVVAYTFYRDQLTRRTKYVLLVIAGLAILGVAALTLLRSASSLGFSAYAYLSIPMGLLSHFIEVVDGAGFRSFGASFLYPLFYLLNAAMKAIGAGSEFLGDLVYYVGLPQEEWVAGLFPNRVYNAFATMFYYLYLDFGIVGIPVLSGLFGAFVTFVYRKAFLGREKLAFMWYLLLFQTLLGSFMIWQPGGTKYFLSMFIFAVLTVSFRRGSAQKGMSPYKSARGASPAHTKGIDGKR